MSKRKKIFVATATGILILVIVASTLFILLKPKEIHDLKLDTVYIADDYIPGKHSSVYYVELKSDGTYILMYDKTRGYEEDYGYEAGFLPYIEYRKGTYEKKGTDYILHATEGGGVGFIDLEAVKKKQIFEKGTMTQEEVEEDHSYNPRALWKTEDNKYRLGYLLEDGSYAEDTDIKDYLYTSDRKDIPDSLQEFFKEYKLVEEETTI